MDNCNEKYGGGNEKKIGNEELDGCGCEGGCENEIYDNEIKKGEGDEEIENENVLSKDVKDEAVDEDKMKGKDGVRDDSENGLIVMSVKKRKISDDDVEEESVTENGKDSNGTPRKKVKTKKEKNLRIRTRLKPVDLSKFYTMKHFFNPIDKKGCEDDKT